MSRLLIRGLGSKIIRFEVIEDIDEPEDRSFLEESDLDYEEPVIEQIDEYPLFTEDSFSEENMEEFVFDASEE